MSGVATGGGGLGTTTLAAMANLLNTATTGYTYSQGTTTTTTTWNWTPLQAAQYLQAAQAQAQAQQQALQFNIQQQTTPAGYTPAARPMSKLRPNRFLDASDLLEDFIAYIAPHGVTKAEFRRLPLELFIQWLVLESAKADGEDTAELPDPVLLLTDRRRMVAADLAP